MSKKPTPPTPPQLPGIIPRKAWIKERVIDLAEAIAACARHPNRDLELVASLAWELDALCVEFRPSVAQEWLNKQKASTLPEPVMLEGKTLENLLRDTARLEELERLLCSGGELRHFRDQIPCKFAPGHTGQGTLRPFLDNMIEARKANP